MKRSSLRRRRGFFLDQHNIQLLEPRRLLAAIASDQTVTGNIATPTQVDSYTFAATAGDSVIAFAAETVTANFDPAIQLVAPNGTTIVASDQGEVGADIFAENLATTGTYTLKVFDGGSNDTGSYAMTMAHLPSTQSPNDGDGGALTSGPRVNGTISAGDLDVYTIAANAGDNIWLSIADTGATTFEPQMLVYGPAGGANVAQDVGDVGADLNFTAASSGTYYVVVKDWTNDNVGGGLDGDVDTGTYALTMAKVPGTQTNPDDGGALTSGPRVLGTIDLGDLDVYTIAASSGDQVILSIADTGGATFEPEMITYDPTGATVPGGTDMGDVGADVNFTAGSSGTYYVVVKDWTNDNVGNGFDGDIDAGTYALTMAKVPGAQTNVGDGGVLTSGPRVLGTIDLGDIDVYTFTANANDQAILDVADTSGTAFNPQIAIYGPTGAAITSDFGDVGVDVNFTAPTSGTYYAVVRDTFNDNVGGGFDGDVQAGTYAITLAKVPGAQTDDSTDGGALTSGQRKLGSIAIGDLDVYTVAANSGNLIWLNITDTNFTNFEPEMRIFSPNGTAIDDVSGDVSADTSFTASTSGTYYIVVKDLSNDNVGGGADGDIDAGAYALTMAKIPGTQTDDGTDGGALTSGVQVNGTLTLGDLDVYTIAGTAGGSIIGTVRSVQAADLEAQAFLYSPTGTLLDSSNGSSDGNVVADNLAASGTYYVVVKDHTSRSGNTVTDGEPGEYTMTFAFTPGSQPTDADSKAITSGTVTAGSIGVGDEDVYTFPVTAGTAFSINLAETTVNSAFTPAFRLYNEAGGLVIAQTNATSISYTNNNPLTSGTYTLVVYDNTGINSGSYSLGLNHAAGTDTFAPSVVSAAYQYDAPIPTLRVLFSEDVSASFDFSDVTIFDVTTNSNVDSFNLSTDYNTADNRAIITFPGETGRVLPNGNYQLRINHADITDNAGNPLNADIAFNFFVLAGDANHDGKVDVTDLGIFASNWQGGSRTFSRGDFNYDGTVDVTDLGILASNWQKNNITFAAPSNAAPMPSLDSLLNPPPATTPPVRTPVRTASRAVDLVGLT